MFLNHSLSEDPVPAPFIDAGADSRISPLFDVEDGPIAISDLSEGLNYQKWVLYYKDAQIWLAAPTQDPTVVLTDSLNQITDISFCFDQNGRLQIVWKSADKVWHKWFDSTVGAFVITPYNDIRTPKLTLDDRRPEQKTVSDIVFSYIKSDGSLAFRLQRDRYSIERILDTGPFVGIHQVYMNNALRLQWLLTKEFL